MSLEKILEALENEAGSQIEQILNSANADAERIKAEASAKGRLLQEEDKTAVQGQIHLERTRILNQAKSQSRQIILKTREELISRIAEAALEHLGRLRQEADYPHILGELVMEAISFLEQRRGVRLKVSEADGDQAIQIADDLGIEANIEPTLHCSGGVKAVSTDGRILVDNTFEERLQRALFLYRTEIARLAFPEE
ncbi:MAG: hypothetical protein HY645_01230 [Acidobacteria bacterium]|nr:hypothetical protein [Acidobacteriota bacterium]